MLPDALYSMALLTVCALLLIAAAGLAARAPREGCRFTNDRNWPTNFYYHHRWEWVDEAKPPALEPMEDDSWLWRRD